MHGFLRDGALSSICAAAEAALLRRVWREWHNGAADRVEKAKRAHLQRMTPYQKMLFSRSVAVYYERLARSRREQERRGRLSGAEAAQADARRKRRLRRTIAEHGNIVNRNILAVMLSQTPRAHGEDWDGVVSPERSRDLTLGNRNSKRCANRSRQKFLLSGFQSELTNNSGNGSSTFYRYGSRSERLLAIERDFDRLPSDARVRVFRTLKKWDMLPGSPPRESSKGGTTQLHSRRESAEQVSRRLDALDTFAGAEEDTQTTWWESEAELRQYLARVLVDAFGAEDAAQKQRQ
ncbi:hypothetical protein DQ04_05091020 [Trypanosoma grayi]|uniref:hypothetical protein n=1 Tax=Trypanosoma grayi TaxID=71804 RepID=UPI0004F47D27|nr:hypothetical protein DQ04_05091020 [Trypanosoma grayi]KEG09516.1 hypothetical protein DQ04_05091020 [Trypanosoma grayi]